MTHEDAKKFLENYLQGTGRSSELNRAIAKMLNDMQKIYNTLEQLSEPNNKMANQRLRETGSHDYYASPLTVEIVHKLIQEL